MKTDSTTTGRILAIGDIHGCNGLLKRLLDRIGIDPLSDTLILIGDYLDRGPEVRGVIDTLLDLKETCPNLICLKGNHESMFLNYYLEGRDEELFLNNGGQNTLDSYGISLDEARKGTGFPEHHLRFLASLPLSHETDELLLCPRGAQAGHRHRRSVAGGYALDPSRVHRLRTGISAGPSSSATPPSPNL